MVEKELQRIQAIKDLTYWWDVFPSIVLKKVYPPKKPVNRAKKEAKNA